MLLHIDKIDKTDYQEDGSNGYISQSVFKSMDKLPPFTTLFEDDSINSITEFTLQEISESDLAQKILTIDAETTLGRILLALATLAAELVALQVFAISLVVECFALLGSC